MAALRFVAGLVVVALLILVWVGSVTATLYVSDWISNLLP